jgi:hypothetical protein
MMDALNKIQAISAFLGLLRFPDGMCACLDFELLELVN